MPKPNGSDKFPARLRETRNKRDLEQSQLAEKSGIPATSISHFEAGRRKPSLINLGNLADALNVSIDYLMGRTDNPTAHIDSAVFRNEELLSEKDLDLVKDIKNLLANRSKD